MRRTSWAGITLSLALSVPPAFGQTPSGPAPPGHVILTPEPDSTEVVEIHLGTPSPAPARDRSRIDAVESFLAARQDGSIDRTLAERVRTRLRTQEDVPATTLFGPKGGMLAAFDFRDDSIESTEEGFRVPVTLLFTNKDARIVETRDESLTFLQEGAATVCTDLRTTNVVSWTSDGVRAAAKMAGAEWELDRIERHLREWSSDRDDLAAYSVSSVKPRGDGSFLVSCQRYEARPGRRGYHVDTSPIVLRRSGDSIRIGTD